MKTKILLCLLLWSSWLLSSQAQMVPRSPEDMILPTACANPQPCGCNDATSCITPEPGSCTCFTSGMIVTDPATCSCACPSNKPFLIPFPTTPTLGGICSECNGLNRIKLRGAPDDGCCPIGSKVKKGICTICTKPCSTPGSFLPETCTCCTPEQTLANNTCCKSTEYNSLEHCCPKSTSSPKAWATKSNKCCPSSKLTTTGSCCDGATPYIVSDKCNACSSTSRTKRVGSMEADGCCADTNPYLLDGLCTTVPIITNVCLSGAAKIAFSTSVSFPETPTGTCNNGGSTTTFDQKIKESKIITLPADIGTICNATFTSQDSNFEYDDEFLIAYDNTVIASSYYVPPSLGSSIATNVGSTATNIFSYNWANISKTKYDWNKPQKQYCASPKISATGTTRPKHLLKPLSCTIPKGHGVTTIKKGALNIELHPEAAALILGNNLSAPNHTIDMVTYGNGVTAGAGDCYHSAFTLNISVSYIPKSSP